MAFINFPASPANNQTYSANGVYYYYDGGIGAWVTSFVSRPLDASINTQIVFNDSGYSNGSNGMVFNKTSNTATFNNVAVTLNVSATYFMGNGSFLTGVASDLSPAYNTANAAFNKANTALQNTSGAVFTGNFFVANSVGIGRANTNYALDVVGTVNASALLINGAALSGGASIGNETSNTSTYYPVFTTTTSGTMSVANTSSTKLYFVPSTGTLSATIFNSLSDFALKTDIEELDGIELLNKVNPVSFKWKNTSVRSYGVIAQELEKVLPELVETNDQGLKSVSYIPMIAMLIDVVKKQDKEIEKIKKLLNSKK